MPRKKTDGTKAPVGASKAKRAPRKHMAKKGAKWTTWLEIDGKIVDGSEQKHSNMLKASNWLRGKSLN